MKKTDTIWKTAIYIRLSREDGNDESYSVTNQKQRLAAFFDQLLLEETIQLIDFYVDDGCTGTDSNREDFQRMLTDIDNGAINCVIVKDLSRLSRNDWECKRYLQDLFVVKDVRFISLELPKLDSYKNPDSVYELGLSIQSMYNENHCRETSVKVRGTFDTKRKKGEFIGSFAPYGYMKDPADKHHLIVDRNAAPIVRDIFHWFVYSGMSRKGIVKKLNILGVPCPSAYKRSLGINYYNPSFSHGTPLWSARSITSILQNETYLGHTLQGKQKVKSYKVHKRVNIPKSEWVTVENTHKPIIGQETFSKAQELIMRNTRTVHDSVKQHTLSGFLRCADCGKSMGRTTLNRRMRKTVYYICRTYLTQGVCTRHSIRHDMLEAAVLETIRKQIELIGNISEILDEANNAPMPQTGGTRLVTALQLKRQALEKTAVPRSSLYIDWKNGDISREEYLSIKKGLEEKVQQLKLDIETLEGEIKGLRNNSSSNNPYFNSFLKHKNIQSLDRGILAELVKTIYVHEGGGLTIDFNFADQYRRAAELVKNELGNRNGLGGGGEM
ncbi:MAG: recombinase family protein [Clostridiales bacterium]|nr:recombinase family protein [Clostridiales bacterium]